MPVAAAINWKSRFFPGVFGVERRWMTTFQFQDLLRHHETAECCSQGQTSFLSKPRVVLNWEIGLAQLIFVSHIKV